MPLRKYIIEIAIVFSNLCYGALPQLMPGWPDTIPGAGSGNPFGGEILGDIDNDGDLEVLWGCGQYMYVWRYDGTLFPNWPQEVDAGVIMGSPALGDVDGDGSPDVIACAAGAIYVWNRDGELLTGWPQEVNGTIWTPSLSDLNEDGTLEIVVIARKLDSINDKAYVFQSDGSYFPGWPQPTDSGTNPLSPSIGDIDNDGDLEILGIANRKVHAWHHDGTVVDGWPIDPPEGQGDTVWCFRCYTSPALADFDGDGDLEILVISVKTFHDAYRGGRVHIWHYDGTPLYGWPQDFYGISTSSIGPSIGDLDDDGDLEVVVATCDSIGLCVYAWHHDGTIVDGWPAYGECIAVTYPTIGDIDGDGYREVIAGDSHIIIDPETGFLHAYEHTGVVVDGWPMEIPGFTCGSLHPIGDVNGDGSLNLAVTTHGDAPVCYVYLFDFLSPYNPDKIDWGCYNHDIWHTGCYGFQVPGVEEKSKIKVQNAKLEIYPNPFTAVTRIKCQVPSGVEKSTLQIYDLSGRLAKSFPLITNHLPLITAVEWDAKELSAGIYFATLVVGDYKATKKLILIR